MGMHNYLQSSSDKFLDVELPKIIENCDTVGQAKHQAYTLWNREYRMCPDLSYEGLMDHVVDMWNEHLSKYNMGGC